MSTEKELARLLKKLGPVLDKVSLKKAMKEIEAYYRALGHTPAQARALTVKIVTGDLVVLVKRLTTPKPRKKG